MTMDSSDQRFYRLRFWP